MSSEVKLGLRKKLIAFRLEVAVWTKVWPRSAAPVPVTSWTVVTKFSLAIRLNHHGITALKRRRVPGCANAAKLDASDWHALRKRVHRNHDNWDWPRAANAYLIPVSAFVVRRESKRDLSAGVRDLAKVFSRFQSGYPFAFFGRSD